ncbi:hypothetical protein EDI_156960 [Entamoeba dispar SAW760]|uniref:VHS domain-containing protein n=1 Tax=Entamoeba dispar (strain ATCC PRA-260 / SAW760) TaxID=370354 RepID=B0EIT3_ENTDS|nr:uncharacterized protein EDI_156960 [Entamoeba dispar SAW760]EDR25581.1 hypothetical protein EDI_156960 [Entamoeba dispar SAW760]|eukprot:EDR25581.1 hypothetical protein EDI_156960 [Entamoeba dispar SAW760]
MSVSLSDVVNYSVHESQCPPSEEQMRSVSYVISKVPGASRALRIQLVNKFKSYFNKAISENEVLNCLYLTQYVVQRQSSFRAQVADIDFIASIEILGKKKNQRIQKQIREMLEEWSDEYPNELREYNVLYLKYVNEGIITISSHKTKKFFDIPSEITSLIPSMEHFTRKIQEYLEDNQRYNLQKLYEHSSKLNSKIQSCIVKYKVNDKYDQKQINEVDIVARKFNDLVLLLADKINKSNMTQTAICTRLFTHPLEDHKIIPIQQRSHVLTPKHSLQIQPPPSKLMSSKQRKVKTPCSHLTFSYQNNALYGKTSGISSFDDQSWDFDNSIETPLEVNSSERIVQSSNVFEEMDFDEQSSLL